MVFIPREIRALQAQISYSGYLMRSIDRQAANLSGQPVWPIQYLAFKRGQAASEPGQVGLTAQVAVWCTLTAGMDKLALSQIWELS